MVDSPHANLNYRKYFNKCTQSYLKLYASKGGNWCKCLKHSYKLGTGENTFDNFLQYLHISHQHRDMCYYQGSGWQGKKCTCLRNLHILGIDQHK